MARGKKTKKTPKKTPSNDGRAARGEFKRKLWAHAAVILQDSGNTPDDLELFFPKTEDRETLEKQEATLAKTWNDVVAAVHARSLKRDR